MMLYSKIAASKNLLSKTFYYQEEIKMITRELIIEKLQQKYPQYHFTPQDIVKNGDVHLKAICVRDESPIAPTIYTDEIISQCDEPLYL